MLRARKVRFSYLGKVYDLGACFFLVLLTVAGGSYLEAVSGVGQGNLGGSTWSHRNCSSKGAVKESHTHHWGKFLKMGTDEARLNRSSSFQCRCW